MSQNQIFSKLHFSEFLRIPLTLIEISQLLFRHFFENFKFPISYYFNIIIILILFFNIVPCKCSACVEYEACCDLNIWNNIQILVHRIRPRQPRRVNEIESLKKMEHTDQETIPMFVLYILEFALTLFMVHHLC